LTNQVLLVEDSEVMRSLMTSMIEEIKGVRVIAVENGFEALKTLPQQPIRLIITDINMPDINGLEVVSFVKNHPDYRSIPLIIVSTEQGKDDIQKGLSLGASAYITKPFKPESLKKVVQDVLTSSAV
jgi:two-component system, chemotaxis family, chemotaxis protein CheY